MIERTSQLHRRILKLKESQNTRILRNFMENIENVYLDTEESEPDNWMSKDATLPGEQDDLN